MGFMKKKDEGKIDAPEVLARVSVVMHSSSTLQADDKGEYVHALFQTNEALTPVDWSALAGFARKGADFVLVVFDGEEKDDSKSG